MDASSPYNPLTKRNLAASIAGRLLRQQPEKLPPAGRFVGAGVYLIYYTGDFDLYKEVANANRQERFRLPIYVGKAAPSGTRKGGQGLDTPHGNALWKRLCEHTETLKAARNLSLDDFTCRWLVVDEVFLALAESLLISHYKPLWNLVVDGFGNHPPGRGRALGKKPAWDVLHPGRRWAEGMAASTSESKIRQLVLEHLATTGIPPMEPA